MHDRLALREPEAHAQIAEHRACCRQVVSGAPGITGSPVQGAKPQVAVRDERSQAELLSEIQRGGGLSRPLHPD